MKRLQIPVAQQMARSRELDRIRLSRPLTPEEQAEADNLMDRAYQRERRAAIAERFATRRASFRTAGGRA